MDTSIKGVILGKGLTLEMRRDNGEILLHLPEGLF